MDCNKALQNIQETLKSELVLNNLDSKELKSPRESDIHSMSHSEGFDASKIKVFRIYKNRRQSDSYHLEGKHSFPGSLSSQPEELTLPSHLDVTNISAQEASRPSTKTTTNMISSGFFPEKTFSSPNKIRYSQARDHSSKKADKWESSPDQPKSSADYFLKNVRKVTSLPSNVSWTVTDDNQQTDSSEGIKHSKTLPEVFNKKEKRCEDNEGLARKKLKHCSLGLSPDRSWSEDKWNCCNSSFESADNSFTSKKSSSFVIYDECSSDEEKFWDEDPNTRKEVLNNSKLNVSKSTYWDCFSKTTFPVDVNNDESFKSTGKYEMLGKPPKNWLYSIPVDISTISEMIDLRLIGKHDEFIHSSRKKIFILGDSHTRFLVNGMTQILRGFSIYTICKPSAKTAQVFSGVEHSISELTKNDFLILFCGTNDMWNWTTFDAKDCISRKLDEITNTNILMCNVPRNYSESESSYVQKNISSFNEFLSLKIKELHNAELVNLNRLKERIFFTKHGLHFNGTGKVKICELLCHKLVDYLNKINFKIC